MGTRQYPDDIDEKVNDASDCAMKSLVPDLLVSLFLAGVVGTLSYPTLGNFWMFDDLQILKHAFDYRPWQYFLEPRVWRELSSSNLTPFVTLSFDLDLALFGFTPKWFYLHHFVSFWAVTVLLYATMRLWADRGFALTSSLLFAFSAPARLASELLMLRHYIEGGGLALLSLLLFTHSLRRGSFRLACASAIPCWLAMAAKELYVPLPVCVLFLPEKDWRTRLRYAVPLLFTLPVYALWRSWMLGRVIGGYSKSLAPAHLVDFLAAAGRKMTESVLMISGSFTGLWEEGVAVCLSSLLVLTCAIWLIRQRRASGVIFFVVLWLFVLLPLVPLLDTLSARDPLSYRLLFAFSLSFASLVGASSQTLWRLPKLQSIGLSRDAFQKPLRASIVLAVTLIFSAVAWSSLMWISFQRAELFRPLAAEGLFLMESNDTGILMVKTTAFLPMNNYYENLDFLRRHLYGSRIPDVVSGVFVFVDNVSADALKDRRVYKYDRTTGVMREVTDDYVRTRTEYLSRVRELPLRVTLYVREGAFNFSLGPAGGRFFLLTGYRPGIYNSFLSPLPRSLPNDIVVGQMKWYIRFGRESEKGEIAFSPEWRFDFSTDQELRWEQK